MKCLAIISLWVAAALAGYGFRSGAMEKDPCPDARNVFHDLSARAAEGDSDALFRLGRLYEHGYDTIPRDSVTALRLYAASAEAGFLPAMNYLGYMLINGRGALRDAHAGLSWIEKAAMAGDATAQSNIGYLLLHGEGVEHDAGKAAFWLERAARSGVAPASSMLGDLYLRGNGVPQDSMKAEKCYYAAVDGGLSDAAYKLEKMLRSRWLGAPDSLMLGKAIYFYTHGAPDVAVPILRRIARMDSLDNALPRHEAEITDTVSYAAALALLGDAAARARGTGYDHDKSTYYYFRAASEGNPAAAFVISELLEIFPDVLAPYISCLQDQDTHSAAYWRHRAEAGGVRTAEEATARLFNP